MRRLLQNLGQILNRAIPRQALVSLLFVALGGVVPGVILGLSTDSLEDFPGLLLMVPAAIALRGNIFGGLGSRLGTAIHSGTYQVSLRPNTVVGENIWAAMLLNLLASVALAVMAKVFATVFGVAESIPIDQFITISVIGGLMASVVVLVVALVITTLSVRRRWDPDNVTVPLVTVIADIITLPALFLAVRFFGIARIATPLALVFVVLSLAALPAVWRIGTKPLKRILLESTPVLLVAIGLDLFAGAAVENRLERFADFPSFLVLLPGFLSIAGSLGGILTGRLSTKLHLGLAAPSRLPDKASRGDLGVVAGLSLPSYLALALVTLGSVALFGIQSPGVAKLIGVALLGGVLLSLIVMSVGYYATMVAVRAGLNPDTYGIPIMTAVLDLIGVFVLILAFDALI